MNVKLVAFGVARDILGSSDVSIDVGKDDMTIGDLKKLLCERYNDFNKLVQFSLAVNEEYQEDHFQLKDHDEVVIIPPVSGG